MRHDKLSKIVTKSQNITTGADIRPCTDTRRTICHVGLVSTLQGNLITKCHINTDKQSKQCSHRKSHIKQKCKTWYANGQIQ